MQGQEVLVVHFTILLQDLATMHLQQKVVSYQDLANINLEILLEKNQWNQINNIPLVLELEIWKSFLSMILRRKAIIALQGREDIATKRNLLVKVLITLWPQDFLPINNASIKVKNYLDQDSTIHLR